MSLIETIQKDVFAAVKEGKNAEADILRIVLADLKNARIAKGADQDLSDEEEIKVVFGEAKKVKDSMEQFERAGREDLLSRETEQLAVIERYLPAQADDSAVRQVVKKAIADTGASGTGQIGMVMGAVMKEMQGKADGKLVSDIAKEELSKIQTE